VCVIDVYVYNQCVLINLKKKKYWGAGEGYFLPADLNNCPVHLLCHQLVRKVPSRIQNRELRY
jgi:hypothetical protein